MSDGGRRGGRRAPRRSRRDAPAGRVVGGLHPVRELLRAGRPVDRLLLAEGRESNDVLDEIVAAAAAAGIPTGQVPRAELDDLTDGLVHQGVVVLAPPFAHATLADVLDTARERGEQPLLVALDGVTDTHNLGSIARTADAVGAHALLVPRRRAAGITPAAEKAAAGALAHLPVVAVTNLVRTLADLREHGIWSLGLDADAVEEIDDHPLAGEPCVLVVGAEGAGLARLTRERCDGLVRLPMRGNVGSLNASVAAAVALYALLRRRA